MARGVNKVILIGHLGNDPEVRYTAEGKAVATASLATTESWSDKRTGGRQEKTTWHNLVLFEPLSKLAAEHLAKGAYIYTEGSIDNKSWTDKNTGEQKQRTTIKVKQIDILKWPNDNQPQEPKQSNEMQQQSNQIPQQMVEFDDYIPF